MLGWQEHIHGVNKELTEIGIGERQQIVRDHAKFTSQKASNHLLSFGEFAAMYLLAWNPQNWPNTMWDDVFSVKDLSHNNATNNDNRGENNKIDIYRKQLQQLKRAYRVLPHVRRVLANIPTYMICDDHDITDDWNITKEWYENVKNSDCGKQIVANGLAAFWAFQAWGNNPDLYSQEFVYKITNYLEKDGKVNSIKGREFEDYLWEFHGWSFAVPATTIYPLTIFLDCRTQREYDSLRGAPNLLNDDALHSFLQLTRQADYRNGDPLVIVSQTPVFGFELAEKLQAYLAHLSGPYNWDLESWASNERGFTRFITFIIEKIEPRYCVFLSGDVHYGFTMDASFTLLAQENRSQKEEKRLRAIQLTSSALKSTSLAGKLLIGDILDRIYEFMSNKKAIRIGWNVQFGSPKHMDQLLKEQNENAYKNIPNEKLSSIVLHLDESRTDKTGLDVLKNHFRIDRSPAWMESRRLVKMLGYKHTSVLADNNLGMVIFDKYSRTIEHKLLVRQANDTTKICEAVVQIPSWIEDFP